MRSVRFGDGRPLESSRVQRTIDSGESRLGTDGRLVIRKSGTEPVIRIMAEGEDEELVAVVIDEICEAILAASTGAEDAATRPSRLDPAQAAE
jgi:phosphoglucosamine mutase